MKQDKENKKSIGSILTTVAFIVLIPILLVNLWIIFQSKTNEDKVPSVFGIKPFIVLSGSMESQIHKGDLIFTIEVDPSTIGIDDVIAFRDAEGTVTTHRVIDMVEEDGKTFFITKGDNNNTQDLNLVAFEDVEGIYLGRLPGLGSMMDGLSNPTTLVIVILGITVIFVIGFSISNKKDRELERLEYLEFKRMKEEMMAGKTASKTKKMKSIKAVEDEDDEDDELLEDEDEEDFEEEIEEPKPRKKKATTSTKAKAKTSTTKKQPAKKATSTTKTASKSTTSTKAKSSTTAKKAASTKTKSSSTKTKTTSTAKKTSSKKPATKSTTKKTK